MIPMLLWAVQKACGIWGTKCGLFGIWVRVAAWLTIDIKRNSDLNKGAKSLILSINANVGSSGLCCPGGKWQREDPAKVLGSVWASLNISHGMVDTEFLSSALSWSQGDPTNNPNAAVVGSLHPSLPSCKIRVFQGSWKAGSSSWRKVWLCNGWPCLTSELPMGSSRILLFTRGDSIRASVPVPGPAPQGQDVVPIPQHSTIWKSCRQPWEHWGCFGGFQARPCPSK